MDDNIFSSMEIDAIGEIMNISLGSSATAVSNMLDHRVDITTPTVSVMQAEEFELGPLEPAIGLVIKYVEGLAGSNIMLLKRSDIKVIVDILMGSETPDEEFELNELTVSAVCEVMNQMMGASATALSDFLERVVNISTPESFEVDNFEEFKNAHFPVISGPVVVVRFVLSIENALQSEFMNIMSVELARELVSGFGLGDYDMALSDSAQAAPAPVPAPQQAPQTPQPAAPAYTPAPTPVSDPAPAAAQPPYQPQPGYQPAPPYQPGEGVPPYVPQPQAPYQPPYPASPYGQQPYYDPAAMPPAGQPMPGYAPPPGVYPSPYGYPATPSQVIPQPKLISTQQVQMDTLEALQGLPEEQAQNLDLIMSVPLEVSVEIGRTRRKVQEILAYTKGSLVVLDKLAGDQVDLFVNGKCIARGDVVVIDDNFGIRITEILQRTALEDMAEAFHKG